jgi:hypothetical protein
MSELDTYLLCKFGYLSLIPQNPRKVAYRSAWHRWEQDLRVWTVSRLSLATFLSDHRKLPNQHPQEPLDGVCDIHTASAPESHGCTMYVMPQVPPGPRNHTSSRPAPCS